MKRPRLRAPLVVTILGASLSACGGVVVTPSPSCPQSAPPNESSCDPNVNLGASCSWGMCRGRPITQATCDVSTRRWSVQTERCVIDPPMRACPAAQPPSGARCDSALDRVSCNYGWSECLRGPEYTAICRDNSWQILAATCNPPPPTCPTATPSTGESCVLPSSTECTYGDCFGAPNIYARCDAGRWQVAMASCNPPAPACPAGRPTQGAPCDYPEGLPDCTYGSCAGSPTVFASCRGGRWSVSELSCNPPPIACPPDAPFVGDACTQPSGGSCFYGTCAATPALRFSCESGRWSLDRAMCGDYCPAERPRAGSSCSRDASDPCRYPGVMCDGRQLMNEAQCNPMTHRWVITEFVCR